jgi:hypothetical protein
VASRFLCPRSDLFRRSDPHGNSVKILRSLRLSLFSSQYILPSLLG